jgi:hypothetical protein
MSTSLRLSHPSGSVHHGDALGRGIADVARQLLTSVPRLHARERQFLKDLYRPDVRYGFEALRKLVAIARRSDDPAHREALAEQLRAATLDGEVAIDVVAAADAETEAQGPADVGIRAFERRPTVATKVAAERALVSHQATIRTLLDALAAAPVTAI